MHAPRGLTTLDDWLSWFETLHPKKVDLSLNRVRAVVDCLGLSRPPYHVITVGGTNGKGSCVAFLENIYRAAGYRVGSFTSPHLWKFNERICVNGEWARDQDLIERFAEIENARGNVTLSYFESSAVAAFLQFAVCRVDIAVLEVGMGGRLDAVNVFDADGALISSIDMDHQEWLGDSRELIGHEKAGIVRAGKPAVVADPDPPDSVMRQIARVGARGSLIGHDFRFCKTSDGFRYSDSDGAYQDLPSPCFGGDEQLMNVAACIKLVAELRSELPVSDEALRDGIRAAAPDGRLQVATLGDAQWVFDVAHNPAAMTRFTTFVNGLRPARKTIAVFGVMRDKDIVGVLRQCVRLVDHWCVFPVASERSATADQLKAVLLELGGSEVESFTSAETAAQAARRLAVNGARVLVFGSFYTVGPVMAELGLYSVRTACA